MLKVRKSGFLWAIPLLITISYFSLPVQAQYGGGSGEPNDPYLIYTAEQMNAIGAEPNDWDKHFKLMADIDLSIYTGTDFNIIGYTGTDFNMFHRNNAFTGVFDGNRHIISNFSYTSTDIRCIGLFGCVGATGTDAITAIGKGKDAMIKDLELIEPNIDAGTGDDVGALVGGLSLGTIANCSVKGGAVSGNWHVGGLVGWNSGGEITNCYVTGNVEGVKDVGGLVGINYSSFGKRAEITNCYSVSSITGNKSVGGLVGYNRSVWTAIMWSATISNCYSIGNVFGIEHVGGLVGDNIEGSLIIKCYAAGRVTGTTVVGGLVGENRYSPSTITASFWDIETSGRSNICGIEVPGGSGCDDANGKTTAEMQTAATFLEAGWDFVGETDNGTEDIWKISDGLDYPRLWWEKYSGGTGDPNNPYKIATSEDLILLGESPEDYDKHFIMLADIDLDPNLPGRKVFDRAVIAPDPGSTYDISGNPVYVYGGAAFTGVFDGNGHVISNLNIQHSGQVLSILQPINFGLFGQLHSEAEVKNLGVADVNINIRGDDYYKIGGIVGRNNGNVIQCYSTGSVIGGEFVGGLVGYNSGDVTICYSGCAVTGIRLLLDFSVWPEERSVEGGEGGVGGLVGYNTGSIDMSYSTGAVSGNEYVGGLVGTNGSYSIPKPIFLPIEPNLPIGPIFPVDPNFFVDPNFIVDSGIDPGFISGPIFPVDPNFFFLDSLGSIKNCYATGSVAGAKRFGGLVGENKFGEVVTSFWDIETSGVTSSNAGAGKTTAEMQTASTFLEAGWDFVDEIENGTEDIWWIDEGQDYPRLCGNSPLMICFF